MNFKPSDKTSMKPFIVLVVSVQLGAIFALMLCTFVINYFGVQVNVAVCNLWFVGIIVDIASFLLFSINHLMYRTDFDIGIPIIGWVLYLLSCALCSKPVLFSIASSGMNLTVLIFLKVLEFVIFICIHCIFQFALPRIVLLGIKRKEL